MLASCLLAIELRKSTAFFACGLSGNVGLLRQMGLRTPASGSSFKLKWLWLQASEPDLATAAASLEVRLQCLRPLSGAVHQTSPLAVNLHGRARCSYSRLFLFTAAQTTEDGLKLSPYEVSSTRRLSMHGGEDEYCKRSMRGK